MERRAAAPGTWARAGDPAHDLADVLDRWAPAVSDPGRVHVLVAPRTDRRRALWSAFCDVLGADARDLPLPEPSGGVPTAAPAPVAAERHAELTRLALTWVGTLSTSGYDVRGDLADLVPAATGASVRLPGVLVGRP